MINNFGALGFKMSDLDIELHVLQHPPYSPDMVFIRNSVTWRPAMNQAKY